MQELAPNLKCDCCGKPFYRRLSHVGVHKYCSVGCYKKDAKRASKRGENSPIFTGGKVICLKCGKAFFARKSRIEKGLVKYCSRACSNKVKTTKTERVCPNCGKTFLAQVSRIVKGNGKYCCHKCFFEHTKGERHPHWRGGITSIKSKVRGTIEYARWRQNIFIRDNFTCNKCGTKGGYLEAHHKVRFLKLYNDALSNLPLLSPICACLAYTPMWDVSSGVTMCKKCHRSFHFPKYRG